MKTRLASDLHLDSYPTVAERVDLLKRIFVDGDDYDLAIVPGDLSNFAGWFCTLDAALDLLLAIVPKPIVYVMGNHERYHQDTRQAVYAVKSRRSDKFHALNFEDSFSFGGRNFMGITNWYPWCSEVSQWADGQAIKGLTKDSLTLWRDQEDAKLMQPLDVVISHMLPGYEFVDRKYLAKSTNRFFVNPRPDALERCNTWIYGHTHTSLSTAKTHCRPSGYKGENPLPHWSHHAVEL